MNFSRTEKRHEIEREGICKFVFDDLLDFQKKNRKGSSWNINGFGPNDFGREADTTPLSYRIGLRMSIYKRPNDLPGALRGMKI